MLKDPLNPVSPPSPALFSTLLYTEHLHLISSSSFSILLKSIPVTLSSQTLPEIDLARLLMNSALPKQADSIHQQHVTQLMTCSSLAYFLSSLQGHFDFLPSLPATFLIPLYWSTQKALPLDFFSLRSLKVIISSN